MSYFVFWGHGMWKKDEKPTHTFVPSGSQLYFFARHKEEIDTNRARDIVTALRLLPGPRRAEFLGEMKALRNIRRIFGGGERVRNYRLMPSDGRTWMYEDDRNVRQDVYELVETQEEEGVTLSKLFIRHGGPGNVYLWVPCRAVDGESFVDVGYGDTLSDLAEGHPNLQRTIGVNGGNETVQGFKRGANYSRKVP